MLWCAPESRFKAIARYVQPAVLDVAVNFCEYDSMSSRLIDVQSVEKSFGATKAVGGVSFEVKVGEIFALLGPNGAGKSTLVRMMIGMLPPDSGTINWFDAQGRHSVLDTAEIGYLPEDRGLYRDQKVHKILEYFGQLRGMSKEQASLAAEEWANRLSFEQHLQAKLETLSKGNQQKVQVASAVLHRPRLALLDEPFSGLDPINQEMMLEVIRTLRDDGTTILLSAHQLELVERLADRVFLLSRGRQVLAGTVQEIKSGNCGGYLLQISFAQPVSEADFTSWYSDPGFDSLECLQANQIQLTIKRQAEAIDWLSRARTVGEVTDFRGGSLSLHEIYLRALKPLQAMPAD